MATNIYGWFYNPVIDTSDEKIPFPYIHNSLLDIPTRNRQLYQLHHNPYSYSYASSKWI